MRLLITAGPTREYLDSVRFLSNASSGRFGFALASQAAAQGHSVTLIAGPVGLSDPAGIRTIHVVSAEEMFQAADAAFDDCDAAIMCAAVCDFRPARREPLKLGKHERSTNLELVRTVDICAEFGARKGRRVVIGFALEDHDHRAHAEEKLRRKNCDAIVLNRPRTIGADEAKVEVLRADAGWQPEIRGPKADVASRIILLVQQLVSGHKPVR